MLEIYELLDRFELLYPTNSKLSDLRRSYIDRDLSSIFRLTNADEDLRKAVIEQNLYSIFRLLPDIAVEDIEDLRKAVMEQNLHSIFRLAKSDDLRKLVLEDNTWKLWPLLESYINTQFVAAFKSFYVNNIVYDKDCFSRGQLESKIWLVKELKKLDLDLGTVFLCAGWYSTLATMLFESGIKIDKIRSFDIDKTTVDIAEIFNKPWFTDQWRFKALVEDIMDIDYNEHTWQYWSNANNRISFPIVDVPDTIINTSCEHIADFTGWYNKIPAGKLVILQANDYHEIEEHVNTYNTLEEFSVSAPMATILYKGELELQKYTRFMKIGYK
jgi:hypothetical protein